MAIFMVQNGLTPENIYTKAESMDFPDSIVSYFEGMMGQPEGGFPEKLQKLVLKDKQPITCRPGELLPPEDFDAIKKHLEEKFQMQATEQDLLSYALYPKVFEDYLTTQKKEGSLRYMGNDVFFHGIEEGETCEIQIADGKVLIVKLLEIKAVDENGNREVVFKVNGATHAVEIKDKSANTKALSQSKIMADEDNDLEIGANIPGNILKVVAQEGDAVKAGDTVAVIEAMKMETNVIAITDGIIDKIYVKDGQQVVSGELIAKLKEN